MLTTTPDATATTGTTDTTVTTTTTADPQPSLWHVCGRGRDSNWESHDGSGWWQDEPQQHSEKVS